MLFEHPPSWLQLGVICTGNLPQGDSAKFPLYPCSHIVFMLIYVKNESSHWMRSLQLIVFGCHANVHVTITNTVKYYAEPGLADYDQHASRAGCHCRVFRQIGGMMQQNTKYLRQC